VPAAFEVTDKFLQGRHRIGARPGDLGLRNRAATAIVRKADGWLVDFWPNDPSPSTAPQLKGLTNVDGLWQVHPLLIDGRAQINLTAADVRIAGDAIDTVSDVALGAGSLRVVTSYRLDGKKPRLIITTRFVHLSGGRLGHLSLGDVVKWGNVDYFVDGFGRTPPRFSAQGRWVGRKGAAGDLLLQTLEPQPMKVHYEATQHGLASEIYTAYATFAVAPHEARVVQRAFSYEPLPAAPEKPQKLGTLAAEVRDEGGRPLAAKLSLRGRDGTPDPDFGSDGDERGAGRFVWSGMGSFSRSLPVGRYRALATAGIERSAVSCDVVIDADRTTSVSGRLERVIETPGWISADLHLHQTPSVDADIACSTRVISVAAEGVELAGASDHFVVTDLGPTVAALVSSGQLASRILTLSGSEVSTVGNRFGHFNLYPMQADDDVGYENTTPRRMFAEMRRVSPNGIIQVNHPRWSELGYFKRYRMDPKTARVPLALKQEYDSSFDAIEIFNGVDAVSQPKVRQVVMDWIRLLGQGHRYTATGNSDSHKLFFVDPGLPRNLIRWGRSASDAQDLDADQGSVIRAIREGHVLVTTGPIIDAEILGAGPGDTVRSHAARVPLKLRVRAAPWIDVSEVEVLLGGQGRRVRFIPIKKSSSVVRLDTALDLAVPPKTFVVVIARGELDLPNVYSPKTRPFAVTNPIWIEP
jgi:hypothetical protein